MGKRESITTSQLLNRIRKCGTFQEVMTASSEAAEPSFSMLLYEMMTEKNMKAREIIGKTGIDRSYFYHILSGKKIPGKNVVIRLALTMGCSLNETNRLLRLAGLSNLYPRLRRDAVLIYALEQRKSMQEANELLQEAGEEPLYQ
ncbi:MAG: helix-turn-helix transcriptional regulator [Clostridia bacterium]|nr:helix-turn-helix transcriptional regulator [Clostridia bacterium]